MNHNGPSDPTQPGGPSSADPMLPEVPPFRPDLSLIGDMNKREKHDQKPKRHWFRRRQHA